MPALQNRSVLLVTSNFLPTPSANGVCAYNLAITLQGQGRNVYILSPRKRNELKEEIIEEIPVRRILINPITESINNVKVRNLIHRINMLIHFFMYPLNSIIAIVNYIITISTFVSKHEVSQVIAINNPLLSCYSSAVVKKFSRKEFNFIIYDVDSFSNTIKGKYVNQELRDRLVWRWERIVLNSADLIVVMDNHTEHYSKPRYKVYQDKIRSTSFPVLRIQSTNPKFNIHSSQENVNCLFFGSLSSAYRSPDIACRVFERIPAVSFSLYGNASDTMKMLDEFSSITSSRISHKGFVPYLSGQELLRDADFLVSIGNRESEMVPSKVFEYASFCKPIIHFFSFPEDPVINVLASYPLLLLLDSTLPIDKLVESTQQFIKETYGQRIDSAIVQNLYEKNTPEYSINVIEDFFNRQ